MKSKLTNCFRWGAIMIGLASSGAGLWVLSSPAKYQATTRIEVNLVPHTYYPSAFDPYFIQTQFEIMQSEVVLGRVVETLNLDGEWGKKYGRGTALSTAKAVSMLRWRLDLRLINNTKYIEISVTDENPIQAAKIANAIAETYRELRTEQIRQTRDSEIQGWEDQYQKEENDIKTNQQNLEQLRKQLEATNSEPANAAPSSNDLAYLQARQALTRVKNLHQALNARIESETSIDNSGPVLEMANAIVIVDPAVPPTAPIGLNRWLGAVLLICGLASFVLGFYLKPTGSASTTSKL
jgi:uncharacterized protein involved in exopolysaccharide biosynthesis